MGFSHFICIFSETNLKTEIMSKLLNLKLILILMLSGAFNYSESQEVSGTVTDDASQPLPEFP